MKAVVIVHIEGKKDKPLEFPMPLSRKFDPFSGRIAQALTKKHKLLLNSAIVESRKATLMFNGCASDSFELSEHYGQLKQKILQALKEIHALSSKPQPRKPWSIGNIASSL